MQALKVCFFAVGALILAAGPIVGIGMAKAGYGARGPKYSPKQH